MEVVSGRNGSIKNAGELALRISMYDSYRLFTLYEYNSEGEREIMDLTGDSEQKFYLVFKSAKKEIRIPEYDPNGFFEVDKANGCILFKITKKNAEDILGMKSTDKIFYIIRVFEEKDISGKVLNIKDEVEVYHGKWGDTDDFSAYSTENTVDILNGLVATLQSRVDKLLAENIDLLGKYNAELKKVKELEEENLKLQEEINALNLLLEEYKINTSEGTLLSTDTKYIALENTMDNISFTEEQLESALKKMRESDIDWTNIPDDNEKTDNAILDLDVQVKVKDLNISNLKITSYKNNVLLGSAVFGNAFTAEMYVFDGDEFVFECTGATFGEGRQFTLEPEFVDENMKNVFEITENYISSSNKSIITVKIKYTEFYNNVEYDYDVNFSGKIGKLKCVYDEKQS